MTYRVVQDQPCEREPDMFAESLLPCDIVLGACRGCRGDWTRMVEVAVVEPDDWSDVGIPKPLWVEVEP